MKFQAVPGILSTCQLFFNQPGLSAATVVHSQPTQVTVQRQPTTSVATVRHSLAKSQPTVRHVMQPAGAATIRHATTASPVRQHVVAGGGGVRPAAAGAVVGQRAAAVASVSHASSSATSAAGRSGMLCCRYLHPVYLLWPKRIDTLVPLALRTWKKSPNPKCFCGFWSEKLLLNLYSDFFNATFHRPHNFGKMTKYS